ncbi:hypothetical protein FRC05_000739 [Tulasnella sp. 425]|nr:hypothetical protein FRC05_000739 [Tulasnella sp. 425]
MFCYGLLVPGCLLAESVYAIQSLRVCTCWCLDHCRPYKDGWVLKPQEDKAGWLIEALLDDEINITTFKCPLDEDWLGALWTDESSVRSAAMPHFGFEIIAALDNPQPFNLGAQVECVPEDGTDSDEAPQELDERHDAEDGGEDIEGDELML